MPNHLFTKLLVLSCSAIYAHIAIATEPSLKRQQFQIGTNIIDAELALTAEERQRGLMFRESLGENQGMMFQFAHADHYCMWMKNTLIPLSIAFIDEQGKIINIEEMKAHSEETTCAKNKARYALEMNTGWYQQRQIEPGQHIHGLPLDSNKQ
ncbi:DUF192 domain-containing protein [Undibacterium baiyunense]|uniref:DUF192 domain-containing protein n=1 Tax=Undibacterium baiyunense TaxID=2828731 RepID=A0A941DF90_9BURK|nr:DUF192 domain-containing protein [Undibacterium baiyunense]MBR7746445.1 DUF192 domain-containing protein [Undibacterium baiyunense]